MQWLLAKEPASRPPLGVALCVPLVHRAALGSISAYKPIAMPERQRRTEAKELTEQASNYFFNDGCVCSLCVLPVQAKALEVWHAVLLHYLWTTTGVRESAY